MTQRILFLLLSLAVSGSLVIVLTLVICRLTDKRLSYQWQYYLWILAAARLLLPFAPAQNLMGSLAENITGLMRNISVQDVYTEDAEKVFIPADIHKGAETQGKEKEPGKNVTETEMQSAAVSGWLAGAEVYKQNLSGICQAGIKYVCVFWLFVATLLFLRRITVYQDFVRFLKAGSTPVDDIGQLEALSGMEVRLGVGRAVELWNCPLVSSPLLIGFLHPCIVLPEHTLPEQQFRYTIIHELTHVKRRDMYYKWVVQLLLCVYWFHPLVYLMERQITRLCELSCDEAVTAGFTSDRQRQEYAATLLDAMAEGVVYRERTASLTLSENKKLLKERLEAVMNKREYTAAKKTAVCVLTCAVMVTGIFSGAYTAGASRHTGNSGQNDAAASTGMADAVRQADQNDLQNELMSVNNSEDTQRTITAAQADEMALALTRKIWVWDWVKFFVPYMSPQGLKKLLPVSRKAEWAGSVDMTTGKKIKFTKKQIKSARENEPDGPLTTKDIDRHARMIMQSNGDWDCVSFMLPYMSRKGIRKVVQLYNSKHGGEKKRASDYY